MNRQGFDGFILIDLILIDLPTAGTRGSPPRL